MIAGPYRTGARSDAERARNLLRSNLAAYQVFRRGHVPVVNEGADREVERVRSHGGTVFAGIDDIPRAPGTGP